jgi:hypothetical protein
MGGKNAKNRRFCKCLIANNFRFSYIFRPTKTMLFDCHLPLLRLSDVAFKDVRCGKWACHMPQMTPSYAANDNFTLQKSKEKSVEIAFSPSVSL